VATGQLTRKQRGTLSPKQKARIKSGPVEVTFGPEGRAIRPLKK
jgi:hypothetical protein